MADLEMPSGSQLLQQQQQLAPPQPIRVEVEPSTSSSSTSSTSAAASSTTGNASTSGQQQQASSSSSSSGGGEAPSSSSITTVVVDVNIATTAASQVSDESMEPCKKRPRVNSNAGAGSGGGTGEKQGKEQQASVKQESMDKLEYRLGGILCCAVCLDLPKSAIYQVKKIMCIEMYFFTHFISTPTPTSHC